MLKDHFEHQKFGQTHKWLNLRSHWHQPSAIDGHLKSAQVPWPQDEPANIYAVYGVWALPREKSSRATDHQKSFSSRVQEWVDPNEHFSEDDIVRIA